MIAQLFIYMDSETREVFVALSRLSRILAFQGEVPFRVSNYKKLMLYVAKYSSISRLIDEIHKKNVLPKKNIQKLHFLS